MAAMNELQLRIPVEDVTLIADAIEFYLDDEPLLDTVPDLERIRAYLRYRIAKAGITPPPPRKK